MSDLARFMAKVRRSPDGCWTWTAYVTPEGYGRFAVGGRAGTMTYAHRWSLEHLGGTLLIPGMHVDHLCRNRACVNPEHLEQVSLAENNRRAIPYRDEAARRRTLLARRRPDFDEQCIHGHPRSSDDYVDKRGTIHCRQCKRQRQRAAS